MKYLLPAVSIILLILVVGGAAFYFGQKSTSIKNTPITNPTENISPTTSVETNPTATPTPSASTQSLSGGGILVFKAYTLVAPLDWIATKEKNDYMDNLILTKLNYKLTISQAAGGGGGCIYPGDKPAEMAQSFVSFVEITNPNGFVFRRGQNESGPNTYTVCQKNTSDGSFGFPTNFGNITFTTPGTPDKNAIIFPEVDSILSSLSQK